MSLAHTVYMAAPFFLKRLFADLEGLRRNAFRKYGDYGALLSELAARDPLACGVGEQTTLARLQDLVAYAHKHVPFYQNDCYDVMLDDLSGLRALPLLQKSDLQAGRERMRSAEAGSLELFSGRTSGSTGTPVSYYVSHESLRMSKAYMEAFLMGLGIPKNARAARLSGVQVVPRERKKPPFWLYTDVFHQLQCSSLHINAQTAPLYARAMERYGVVYATGYPVAWLHLAQCLKELGIRPPPLRVLLTDSEGVSPSEQDFLEQFWGCKVYQTYGLSELCGLSVMCAHRRYHLFEDNIYAEILDDDGRCLPDSQVGNIVLTDLNSRKAPYIRYVTGDLGALGAEPCPCGWKSRYLTDLTGRVDDYFLLVDGSKISRLGFVAAELRGAIRSQLVQLDYDKLLIRIIPDANFDPQSAERAAQAARDRLGKQVSVTWELADALEMTASSKTKYLIRKLPTQET